MRIFWSVGSSPIMHPNWDWVGELESLWADQLIILVGIESSSNHIVGPFKIELEAANVINFSKIRRITTANSTWRVRRRFKDQCCQPSDAPQAILPVATPQKNQVTASKRPPLSWNLLLLWLLIMCSAADMMANPASCSWTIVMCIVNVQNAFSGVVANPSVQCTKLCVPTGLETLI